MFKLLVFLILSFPLLSWAEVLEDTVYEVVPSQNGQDAFIKLMSGRVVFFKESDRDWAKTLDIKDQRVQIEIDDNLTIQSLQNLPQEEVPLDEAEFEEQFTETTKMVPTVIPSWNQAMTIWNGMNRSYKSNSECSDRAHVWAWEEWKKHNLYSMKTFLFFTNTYIRAYRYKWWFHVSPSAYVYEYGKNVEHIFDRRYASIPRHMKEWTDIFIQSRKSCPETTYRNYRNNNNGKEHCYVVRADMYYRLPLHVRNLEDSGIRKTQFSTSEVNFSYRAFTRKPSL